MIGIKVCILLFLSAALYRSKSVANTRVPLEIFLPSYADYHFDDLERRQDPVQDIILTEEEVGKMFPQ